jgi:hypothetical protein
LDADILQDDQPIFPPALRAGIDFGNVFPRGFDSGIPFDDDLLLCRKALACGCVRISFGQLLHWRQARARLSQVHHFACASMPRMN